MGLDTHRFLENFAWEVVSDCGVIYWNSVPVGMAPRASCLVCLDFALL